MATPVKRRRILSAYDAWYFLREHPKLNRKERNPLTPEEAEEAKMPLPAPPPGDQLAEIIGKRAARTKHYRVVKDEGGNLWREWKIKRPAVEENLNIHWATVDERGRVNSDDSKNTRAEVWLELGPVEWGYHQPEYEVKEGARCYKMHFHDVDLDCGAPTFDEALIKLARKVQKKYGDYPVEGWQLFRPKPLPPRRAPGRARTVALGRDDAMKDEDTNATAWKIHGMLLAAGFEIGNASVSIIRRELDTFGGELLERAALVAEMPITGNGHSPETRAKSEHALTIARAIRDLKGPKVLRVRRLK